MERLTIKELAPYLPYELKLYIWNGGYEKPLEHPTLIGLHGDSIIQSGYRFKSIHCGDEIFSRPEMSNSLSIIKPLLRPLSQLTEEIEHNGERFVPYQRLYQFASNMGIHKGTFEHMLENIIEGSIHITEMPYYLVKNLLEWHFDIFCLIDRGLALPIDGKEVEG